MIYSRIIGTGSYLPERVLTNVELAQQVDTSHDWIVTRTGIHRRHLCGAQDSTASMAEAAATQALAMAGLQPSAVGLIIVATVTPDKLFPSTACLLQGRLSIPDGPAFDLSAACAGFIYGIAVADQFIRSGQVANALVVGVDALSRYVDWQDRNTCILFGDGAGAVLLQAAAQPGIHSTHLHAAGEYEHLLSLTNSTPDSVQAQLQHYIQMRGSEVFRLAVPCLERVLEETLVANGLQKTDIDWLVPHQANLRIIQAMAKRLELPMEKVILTIADHGNTSAASIPLALDCAVRDGRIQAGHRLLLEGFGGGLAWGSALITF